MTKNLWHGIVIQKQEEYGRDCATRCARATYNLIARAQVNRKTAAKKLRPTLILFNSFLYDYLHC